jgi:histidyl-tRNA synthetase
MTTLKAVRGTRDLLPPETALWNRIEATARQVFARYNFGEIRTPVFEDTALFARGVGEETDIVSKEMFSWKDGGRPDISFLEAQWKKAHPECLVLERPSGPLTPLPDRYLFTEVRGIRTFVEFRVYPPETVNSDLNTRASYVRMLQLKHLMVVPRSRIDEIDKDAYRSIGIDIEPLDGRFETGLQSLTLRPENTAGVVRAYIENKLGESGQLQKLYYIGPQFRRERPQKGRYRQFSQIGAEVIGPVSAGSESPLRDAEVLEMLATLLNELGITGWTLHLNSVGSQADRARYNEALRAALVPVVGQMCADCQRRAVTNPLRVLDCKVPADQPIIETLPVIADSLDEASRAHFAQVTAALAAAGVPYTRNHRLVRGLDYYTRTTFEFTHGGLGAQNALLGGGRYDGLSEMLGGPRAPGIGFAVGEDRLVLTLLAQQGEKAAPPQVAHAFIAPLGDAKDQAKLTAINAGALALARELRHAGLRIELGEGSFRLKKSFEAAEKTASRIVILGEDELQSGILTVKTFATGQQTKVPRAELAKLLAEPAGA